MRIYTGDTTNHRAPAGWHFVVQEPAYAVELDAELWLLERTGD